MLTYFCVRHVLTVSSLWAHVAESGSEQLVSKFRCCWMELVWCSADPGSLQGVQQQSVSLFNHLKPGHKQEHEKSQTWSEATTTLLQRRVETNPQSSVSLSLPTSEELEGANMRWTWHVAGSLAHLCLTWNNHCCDCFILMWISTPLWPWGSETSHSFKTGFYTEAIW